MSWLNIFPTCTHMYLVYWAENLNKLYHMMLSSTHWIIIHGTSLYHPPWLCCFFWFLYKNVGHMQVGKKSLADGFFKVKVNFLLIMFANMSKPCLDFVLAITPIMDETVPWIMYWRESFTGSRRFLLIQWLLMGNVIHIICIQRGTIIIPDSYSLYWTTWYLVWNGHIRNTILLS